MCKQWWNAAIGLGLGSARRREIKLRWDMGGVDRE